MTKTARFLVCLRDDSLSFFNTLSTYAHYPAFQSAQIVIPLAIRSLIKGPHSMTGTKGMEVTTPGFGHSMAQGPAPSKTVYKASWAQHKSVFNKELTVLDVRGCSKH